MNTEAVYRRILDNESATGTVAAAMLAAVNEDLSKWNFGAIPAENITTERHPEFVPIATASTFGIGAR